MELNYKIDFHTHTQDHKRFDRFKHIRDFEAPLSNEDKSDVHGALAKALARDLDVVVVADHNQFTSGFYAKAFVDKHDLPIIVIPACECSVMYNHNEVHVIALGCDKAFSYDKDLHISHVVRLIHDNGGLAILAHPHNYMWVANDLLNYVDGVEVYNGMVATIQPGMANYEPPASFKGFRTRGSDYHFPHAPSDAQLKGYSEFTDGDPMCKMLEKWL